MGACAGPHIAPSEMGQAEKAGVLQMQSHVTATMQPSLYHKWLFPIASAPVTALMSPDVMPSGQWSEGGHGMVLPA